MNRKANLRLKILTYGRFVMRWSVSVAGVDAGMAAMT
jgi:hypothetical protein